MHYTSDETQSTARIGRVIEIYCVKWLIFTTIILINTMPMLYSCGTNALQMFNTCSTHAQHMLNKKDNTMVFSKALEQLGTTDVWGDYQPHSSQHNALNTSQTTMTCWLNQFSALKVYGPDAERFLQGQLTCNLSEINQQTFRYGACCNAKGRTVANFNISFDGENYWLILPSESAQILEKHLQKYKVFFKATLENCSQTHTILGQWSYQNAPHISGQQVIELNAQRRLVICPDNDSVTPTQFNWSPTLNWRLADIKDGIYYLDAEQTEEWIPQHINQHHINGISFNKGCYTGQEIIARLQYLGKAKKALYYYRADINPANNHDLAIESLYDKAAKNQGPILFSRQQVISDTNIALHVLAVLNTSAPEETLYLNQSQEISLSLQNLPYTEEMTA